MVQITTLWVLTESALLLHQKTSFVIQKQNKKQNNNNNRIKKTGNSMRDVNKTNCGTDYKRGYICKLTWTNDA